MRFQMFMIVTEMFLRAVQRLSCGYKNEFECHLINFLYSVETKGQVRGHYLRDMCFVLEKESEERKINFPHCIVDNSLKAVN